MPVHNSHCSYCGTAFAADAAWPRACANCGETTWLNPLPVALVMMPIIGTDGRTGLLTVRRGIEPQLGQIGLPGGFIEEGESWQQAAVRELWEETGLRAEVEEVELADVLSAPHFVILVFGRVKPRPIEDLAGLTPERVQALSNGETQELIVVDHAQPLAFPLHTEMSDRFFAALA
ncbi:8-oxo-dGTP diphosphatase [Catenulispora sp. MAP12-49]|jgi:8-oxo-dGTP diphosphatase|uniref:NUDIX domain-containing protein n=1 Tax=unclassified Catenulispora TaxID=414885 RepID=UPI003518F842